MRILLAITTFLISLHIPHTDYSILIPISKKNAQMGLHKAVESLKNYRLDELKMLSQAVAATPTGSEAKTYLQTIYFNINGAVLGILNAATATLGSKIYQQGSQTCAAIPTTGSFAFTVSSTTYTVYYGTSSETIPTGYTDAGSSYDRRITFVRDAAGNNERFLEVHVKCAVTGNNRESYFVRYNNPDGVSNTSTVDIAEATLERDTVTGAATTHVALRDYSSSASAFDTYGAILSVAANYATADLHFASVIKSSTVPATWVSARRNFASDTVTMRVKQVSSTDAASDTTVYATSTTTFGVTAYDGTSNAALLTNDDYLICLTTYTSNPTTGTTCTGAPSIQDPGTIRLIDTDVNGNTFHFQSVEQLASTPTLNSAITAP